MSLVRRFFAKKQNVKTVEVLQNDGESQSTKVKIDCAGQTDIGKQRSSNQDHFLIANLHKNMHVENSSVPFDQPELFGETMGKLLFVADGMGGAQAGEVASQMAIQEMATHLLNSMHWLFCPKQPEIERFIEDLKAGAMRSHDAVCKDSESDPTHRGMGTTLTVAYLFWPVLYVLHVGDSRCYILRDQKWIQRLTKDQTLAQVLYDHGQLNEVELKESPYNNVLTSAIGIQGEPEAIVYKTRLNAGDRVLLCSDGVNVHMEDQEIESILNNRQSPSEVCEHLINTANDRGGQDNITAVVAFTEPIE